MGSAGELVEGGGQKLHIWREIRTNGNKTFKVRVRR